MKVLCKSAQYSLSHMDLQRTPPLVIYSWQQFPSPCEARWTGSHCLRSYVWTSFDIQRCKKLASFSGIAGADAMAWNCVECSMEKHGNGMEFRCYSGVRTLTNILLLRVLKKNVFLNTVISNQLLMYPSNDIFLIESLRTLDFQIILVSTI